MWTNSGHKLALEYEDTALKPGIWMQSPHALRRLKLWNGSLWLAIDGRRVLWIPPQYRPRFDGEAVTGLKIAFGCPFGRVLVMSFSEAIPGILSALLE